MKTSLALILLAVAVTGCVQTRIQTPDGVKFTTTRFLWQGNLQRAELTTPNGNKVLLEGYASESAQVAEAIAAGVARGLSPAK